MSAQETSDASLGVGHVAHVCVRPCAAGRVREERRVGRACLRRAWRRVVEHIANERWWSSGLRLVVALTSVGQFARGNELISIFVLRPFVTRTFLKRLETQ